MREIESQRLLSAIVVLTMALFVASGMPGAGPWARPLRLAALIGFAVAVAVALAEAALWLSGSGP